MALPVGGFFLLCYLHSLANTELLEYVPTYIGKTSIAFLVVYALAIPYLWCTVRSYYQFTPTVVKRGRIFRSPKVYQYSDIERFKVYPWYTGDPEDIDPDQQMPSDWRLAVTFSNGSLDDFWLRGLPYRLFGGAYCVQAGAGTLGRCGFPRRTARNCHCILWRGALSA